MGSIYPDYSKTQFDTRYSQRLILSSDIIFRESPLKGGVVTDEADMIPTDPVDPGDIPGIDEVLAVEQVLSADRFISLNGFNLALLQMPTIDVVTEEQVLFRDPTTGNLYVGPASATVNIYNSDGTLTSNRTVEGNNKYLYFFDIPDFYVANSVETVSDFFDYYIEGGSNGGYAFFDLSAGIFGDTNNYSRIVADHDLSDESSYLQIINNTGTVNNLIELKVTGMHFIQSDGIYTFDNLPMGDGTVLGIDSANRLILMTVTGGGTEYTFLNGISEYSDGVGLGGMLDRETVISTNGYFLEILGYDDNNFIDWKSELGFWNNYFEVYMDDSAGNIADFGLNSNGGGWWYTSYELDISAGSYMALYMADNYGYLKHGNYGLEFNLGLVQLSGSTGSIDFGFGVYDNFMQIGALSGDYTNNFQCVQIDSIGKVQLGQYWANNATYDFNAVAVKSYLVVDEYGNLGLADAGSSGGDGGVVESYGQVVWGTGTGVDAENGFNYWPGVYQVTVGLTSSNKYVVIDGSNGLVYAHTDAATYSFRAQGLIESNRTVFSASNDVYTVRGTGTKVGGDPLTVQSSNQSTNVSSSCQFLLSQRNNLTTGSIESWFRQYNAGRASLPGWTEIGTWSGGNTGNGSTGLSINNFPKVRISIGSLPTYADNAAAGAAGLTAGELYKTSTGQVMIKL